MMPEWMKGMKIDDIENETARELAEAIGLEATLRLVATYSGLVLYVPKMETLQRALRDREIRRAYDGTNARELARRYDVTDSWVRRVANASRRHAGNGGDERKGQ